MRLLITFLKHRMFGKHNTERKLSQIIGIQSTARTCDRTWWWLRIVFCFFFRVKSYFVLCVNRFKKFQLWLIQSEARKREETFAQRLAYANFKVALYGLGRCDPLYFCWYLQKQAFSAWNHRKPNKLWFMIGLSGMMSSRLACIQDVTDWCTISNWASKQTWSSTYVLWFFTILRFPSKWIVTF